MGFDCSYQEFPEGLEMTKKVYDDPGFAENVFSLVVSDAYALEKSCSNESELTQYVRYFMPILKFWNGIIIPNR
ncbi:hypothetical protein MNBD_GAMMA16-838 [hydrothermal vent metagenome]|uniref:Uncharacterized protein n=1 Tax=hydrothermal vent metagenome TaxID=652676 RepID=A0A3B0ZM41_9ZZZZ